jgi:hypothetical protein
VGLAGVSPNKGLKLTRPVQFGALQLNPGVRRAMAGDAPEVA